MNVLVKGIRTITRISSWVGIVTIIGTMLFIPVAVVARAFNHPILGDVELVQLSMVVLIMFGLGYSQAEDAHISIGLLIDRFSPRIQAIADVFAFLLTFIISWLISWVFIGDALDNLLNIVITTDLLGIPLTAFKFIITIGFFLWGLEAILKVLLSINNLIKGDFTKDEKSKIGGEGL